MQHEHVDLWKKIQSFSLDDPRASFSFSDRLARENGWEYSFALRVIEEYRRFMLLICISPYPLTPSDQVDQVWHLHLIYTRSYWEAFCQQTLGRPVHHGPTQGGKAEDEKFYDWYAKTKELYSATFGHPPPDDIWPSSHQRFSDIHFVRVNTRKTWLIPKPNQRWRVF